MTRVTEVHYARGERTLHLVFDDGEKGSLGAELLRVYSPSAEVRGHGADEGQLVAGKADVGITDIKAVGHYAIQLLFDDGHDSGLYTWQYLRELADNRATLWHEYLARLHAAGLTRDPSVQVIQFEP